MSGRYPRPKPSAGPVRVVVPPEENVVRAMQRMCGMIDALERRVATLEQAAPPPDLSALAPLTLPAPSEEFRRRVRFESLPRWKRQLLTLRAYFAHMEPEDFV